MCFVALPVNISAVNLSFTILQSSGKFLVFRSHAEHKHGIGMLININAALCRKILPSKFSTCINVQ